MMNALVLGGSGFLGSNLSNRLLKAGFNVTAVGRNWDNSDSGRITRISGDAFEQALLDKVMPDIDVVFHLISSTVPSTSMKAAYFDCESNVLGTVRILDAMKKWNVNRIIFTSSGGTVYGLPQKLPIAEESPTLPITAYGVGKISIEKYLHYYSYYFGIQATVLRVSNPFGPGQKPESGQGAIATFSKRILNGETIEIWGDGSVVRDYIYIDDVSNAIVASIKSEASFSVYNIGAGEGHSLLEVINKIETASHKKAEVLFKEARNFDIPEIVLDISKAERELKWLPEYSFSQGIQKYIHYLYNR